jgi:putative transcriptional regulator
MRLCRNPCRRVTLEFQPGEIRALRVEARMSQAVFAAILNISTGYLSKLECGSIKPAGSALAMLDVIRRKGIEAVL